MKIAENCVHNANIPEGYMVCDSRKWMVYVAWETAICVIN